MFNVGNNKCLNFTGKKSSVSEKGNVHECMWMYTFHKIEKTGVEVSLLDTDFTLCQTYGLERKLSLVFEVGSKKISLHWTSWFESIKNPQKTAIWNASDTAKSDHFLFTN